MQPETKSGYCHMIVTEVPIYTIKVHDTVLHEGMLKTVGRGDIKRDDFFGLMLFCNSYNLGTVPVKKVIYPKITTVKA